MLTLSWYLYIPIFLALHLFTKHFLHKLQNLPPTPFLSLPIIGHLYLLSQPLHRTLSVLSKRHGSILFLQLGSCKALVVTSPSLAEECFTKNDVVFANRPNLAVGKYLAHNFTSLAWAPYGDLWRNLRRIASLELLSTYRLQSLASIRADEVKTVIQKLLVLNHDRSRTVDMKTMIYELTMNVMTTVIAGKRFCGENIADAEEAKRFRAINEETFRLAGKGYVGDFLPWMKSKVFERELMKIQGKRDEFMQSLIDNNRKIIVDGKKNKTLIEVLLTLQETEPEYYTDQIIKGLMIVLLDAGTETTTATTEWAFSQLLNNPDILQKAQQEIDTHIGHERLIKESDLSQLHYLSNIISETMRLHPPVPLLVPHFSSEDCIVGGYKVPGGTMLLVNVWAMQNDPGLWVEPTRFNPERFELKEKPDEGVRDGFKLMPFGSGRRSCPGESMGMRMIGLSLGTLLQCFEWERVGKEMVDMSEGRGFTMPKALPLIAKCSPRPCMLPFISQI
ncbi:hypothetical protein ACFE04_005470 [Oxalis oulophora]